MEKSSGMMYAPKGKVSPVCGKGEFPIGVVGMAHGHIYGMCNGLEEAGAEVKLVYDPDPARVERATRAMLGMVKLDIAALHAAADGVEG